tara:strand:+ start:667 stop:1050 length:384 start_codon:yes stop_codon:yes gene_type:complete
MNKKNIQAIIDEVYPKIEKHYGHSKHHECTPYIELHHNIYARITGIACMEGDCNPDAEFDRQENTIVIYWPKVQDKKWIIQSLIHEYQHYLQSPLWMKRYYNMGYEYDTHPYEIAATQEESNWEMFA